MNKAKNKNSESFKYNFNKKKHLQCKCYIGSDGYTNIRKVRQRDTDIPIVQIKNQNRQKKITCLKTSISTLPL